MIMILDCLHGDQHQTLDHQIHTQISIRQRRTTQVTEEQKNSLQNLQEAPRQVGQHQEHL